MPLQMSVSRGAKEGMRGAADESYITAATLGRYSARLSSHSSWGGGQQAGRSSRYTSRQPLQAGTRLGHEGGGQAGLQLGHEGGHGRPAPDRKSVV